MKTPQPPAHGYAADDHLVCLDIMVMPLLPTSVQPDCTYVEATQHHLIPGNTNSIFVTSLLTS
jgi:hypothetical protein